MSIEERERKAADVMWDTLAELGFVDQRDGIEYQETMAEPKERYALSQAAFAVVGRLMITSEGE